MNTKNQDGNDFSSLEVLFLTHHSCDRKGTLDNAIQNSGPLKGFLGHGVLYMHILSSF